MKRLWERVCDIPLPIDCPSTPAAPSFAFTFAKASSTTCLEILNGFALLNSSSHQLVDHAIKLNNVAPSLQLHYKSSSLLRATPSLCPASVLSSSWDLHLDSSLYISAQLPTFPTKA